MPKFCVSVSFMVDIPRDDAYEAAREVSTMLQKGNDAKLAFSVIPMCADCNAFHTSQAVEIDLGNPRHEH